MLAPNAANSTENCFRLKAKKNKDNLRSYFLHWPGHSSRILTHKKWLEAAE